MCYVVIRTTTGYCLGLPSISLACYRQWESQFRNKGKYSLSPKGEHPSTGVHAWGFLSPTAHLWIVGANWEEAQQSRQATKSGIAILSALLKTVGVQVLFLLSCAMGEDAVCKQPPRWGSSGCLIRCGFFKSLLRQSWLQPPPPPSKTSPIPQLTEHGRGAKKIEEAGRSQHLKISWGFPTPFWKVRVGKMRFSPALKLPLRPT